MLHTLLGSRSLSRRLQPAPHRHQHIYTHIWQKREEISPNPEPVYDSEILNIAPCTMPQLPLINYCLFIKCSHPRKRKFPRWPSHSDYFILVRMFSMERNFYIMSIWTTKDTENNEGIPTEVLTINWKYWKYSMKWIESIEWKIIWRSFLCHWRQAESKDIAQGPNPWSSLFLRKMPFAVN